MALRQHYIGGTPYNCKKDDLTPLRSDTTDGPRELLVISISPCRSPNSGPPRAGEFHPDLAMPGHRAIMRRSHRAYFIIWGQAQHSSSAARSVRCAPPWSKQLSDRVDACPVMHPTGRMLAGSAPCMAGNGSVVRASQRPSTCVLVVGLYPPHSTATMLTHCTCIASIPLDFVGCAAAIPA